jgi:prepilin-type N-terminal cleavage/methylation domain-containing protein
MTKAEKGFTLIELLVVIGIIAILAVVVILTINPAELLRQARDSSRISDLGTLKAALSLYLADVNSPVLSPSYSNCYQSNSTAAGGGCSVFASGQTAVASSSRKVNSTGWVPVDFTKMSSGAPIGTLPVDPVNDTTHYYAYAASSSLVFVIDAFMESTRYKKGGANDVVSTDGGDQDTVYEVGTAPGLAL